MIGKWVRGGGPILADENPTWRPDHYSYELWGSKAGLWFPSVKLLDYKEKWQELEASTNPFASVVMAHLKAVETEEECLWCQNVYGVKS